MGQDGRNEPTMSEAPDRGRDDRDGESFLLLQAEERGCRRSS
jgi:hypothetical protein